MGKGVQGKMMLTIRSPCPLFIVTALYVPFLLFNLSNGCTTQTSSIGYFWERFALVKK